MAYPTLAQAISDNIDPKEEIDIVLDCTDLLEEGEQIDPGYTLTVLAESVALGLTIMSGGGYDQDLIEGDRMIRIWVTIDPLFQTDAAFDAVTLLPVELTFETNSTPPRTRQRTFLIPFVQL